MADLTRDDVLKLARLARLELTDEEIETFRTQLSDVLQYLAQLQQADVTGLEPTSQVTGLKNVMRDDEIIDYGVSREELLRVVPDVQDNQIKVNRMVG